MRFRFWLGFALAATIAASALVGAQIVRENETDAFERSQNQVTLRAAQQAEAVAALSIGQLASASAFFQADEHVSMREFVVMADSLFESGSLAGTAFIERVTPRKRRAYERLRGHPITERAPVGTFRMVRMRPEYFPLSFAATAIGVDQRIPLGYDLRTDPFRARFLLRARDTGRPTATKLIRLSLGGIGINVFRPIYRDRAPTRTIAQRRANLIGFATGAFQAPGLSSAVDESLPDDFESQIVEGHRMIAGEAVPRGEAATAPIRIADRTWMLIVRDPNRPSLTLPVLMAGLGLALALLLGVLVLMWSRSERMHELTLQASQDPLTGLKNRRRFEEDLRTELARADRERAEGALLMLDIDEFKRVNDTQGHPAGDRVIQRIADVMRNRTRETDVLARVGGDEFAIVLPRCELGEAAEVAEAISAAIGELLPAEEGAAPITVSVGIAMYGNHSGADFEAVQAGADAALYEAKGAGRAAIRVSAADRESA
jgi:diguanylate cyclase (GGDEF)-like protein